MALDRTLTQIRERSFLDVLDLTMVVVRDRPLSLGIAALVGIAPFAVLNAWLIDVLDGPQVLILIIPLLLMEAPWATAPLTAVLGAMMFDDRQTPGQVFKTILRCLPALITYQIFLRGVLVATGLFYLVIPSRYAFLNEVILLEKGRFWGTPKRCMTLAGQNGGSLFSYWLGMLVFGSIFLLCFVVGTGALQSALTSSEMTWETPGASDVISLKTQLAVWFIIAFFTVTRFLTYIDQRIRLEGWEVKLRLQAVGRTIEQGGRW